jgi:hypothetical protein
MHQFSQHAMSGQHSIENDETNHSPAVEVPDYQGVSGDKIFDLLGDYYNRGCISDDMAPIVHRLLATSVDVMASPESIAEALADAALIVRFVHGFSPAARQQSTDDPTFAFPPRTEPQAPPRFSPMDGFDKKQDPRRTRDAVNIILDAAGVPRIPITPYAKAQIGATAWANLDAQLVVSDWEDGRDPDFVQPDVPRANPYREQQVAARMGRSVSTLTALRLIASRNQGT